MDNNMNEENKNKEKSSNSNGTGALLSMIFLIISIIAMYLLSKFIG